MASVRMVTDSFDPRPHLALLSSPSKSSLFPQPTHFRGHTTYNYSNPKCATGHSFFRAEEEALGSILGIHLCLGAAAWSPSALSYCRTWMYTYSASNDKGHKAVASILTPPVVVYSKAGARSTAMPTLAFYVFLCPDSTFCHRAPLEAPLYATASFQCIHEI